MQVTMVAKLDEVNRRIGDRLRRARLGKGLTLSDLSRLGRLSVAFLSRLERGEATTTIANLIRLSGAVGAPLSEMFDDAPPRARYAHFRRRDEVRVPMINAAGYRYLRLAGDLADQRLDAFELEFPVSRARQTLLVSHDGEEVLYLLSGRIEFQIGRDRFVMEPGDCVHFHSAQPHMGRNIGKVPARLLMVVTPSTEGSGHLPWWDAPNAPAGRGRRLRRR